MQVVNRKSVVFFLVLAGVTGAGAGIATEPSTSAGWVFGVAMFILVAGWGARRPLRRLLTVRKPLSPAVVGWLRADFPFYRYVERERFERDMKIILSEWTFEGVSGVEVTDELRAAVAAGAALLLHGRPDREWPSRCTILLYPDRFDDEYAAGEDGEFEGMAHSQGPVILSVESVRQGWKNPGDGHNVVLHEMAHLLDYENNFANGAPSLIASASAAAWRELVRKEIRRVRIGRSMLRRYAAQNPAELFAVAVENFFERPDLMARRHPELFAALRNIFRIDPLTWD
ncbi:MAG: zinc-dependent peptidase [Bacteroidetes bacterium SB0662_bin_6]|nr:zinc-dependent peptidase [Bacteroidetes bacterium SB0668_bin_1]MYE03568.1 zinc-dependent peptidase [Bacteroidetes bacterium SB0662_bin_6]